MDRPTDRRSLRFDVDWRYRQCMLYRNAWGEAEARNEMFLLPDWEDDECIHNLFVYMVSGKCLSARYEGILNRVVQMHNENEAYGMGSRAKAFIVAGLTAEEVADRMRMDQDILDVYLKVFFDVDTILGNREVLMQVIQPFSIEKGKNISMSDARERLWLTAAYMGGNELLDFFTNLKFDVTPEDLEKSLLIMTSFFTAKSVEYAVFLRSEAIPQASHFEKFLAMQDATAKMMSSRAQIQGVENDIKASSQSTDFSVFMANIGVDVRSYDGNRVGEEIHYSVEDLRAQTRADDIREKLTTGEEIVQPKKFLELKEDPNGILVFE
jgi:hypothetical protein